MSESTSAAVSNLSDDANAVGAISRAELVELIRAGARLTLLEALPPVHFERGHLPGALNLPHDQVRMRAAHLIPNRDADIVVYCANAACRNSHIAAAALVNMGYRHVRVFGGGKAEWEEAGLSLDR